MKNNTTQRSRSIVLVGYQDQGNLGLGYIAANLSANGFHAHIVDFRQRAKAVYEAIQSQRPVAVGFSLIFQHYFSLFADLARYLREKGVACHLTIGGHYPSLRYEDVLRDMPELDSVVMFEGEQTLLELARRLWRTNNWRATDGIAYRTGDRIVCNPLRPLTPDLNRMPFPQRSGVPDDTLGHVMLPITATRGCAHRCAFCSIREFYARVPGRKVRRRSAQNVVSEMRSLYEKYKARIFLFQDDDFPVAGKRGHAWIDTFVQELRDQDLYGKIIWKISCRADEIDPMLLSLMKDAGLYLVYLGIESGTQAGLETLNKRINPNQNIRAVSLLKQLGIMFAYGFMLFDPGSTFQTVQANVRFLKKIVGDGSAAVVYCKMLPYAGTPIEKTLAREGRLTGTRHHPDYRFAQPALDACCERLEDQLAEWVHAPDSVSRYLNLLWHEIAVIKGLVPDLDGTLQYESRLRINTWKSNRIILDMIEATLSRYENGNDAPRHDHATKIHAGAVVDQLTEMRNLFIHRNKASLITAIDCS